MKIFLHIGIEKTGSTTIQRFLTANRTALLNRRIASSQALGVGNNVMLAAYAMNHDRSNSVHIAKRATDENNRLEFERVIAQGFLREIDRLSPDIKSIVLSNEHCHSNLVDIDEVQKLRQLLRQVSDDITIVVYLRRQIDVCISHYSTLLKLGYTRDLDTYVAQTSLRHFYNYLEFVNMWANVFGRDRLKVRIFDKHKLIGGDLIVDFCDAVEIKSLKGLTIPNRMNESLIPTAQRILLALNRFQAEHPFKISARILKLIRSRIIKVFSGKGHMPSKAVAMRKQSIFDASNAELNLIYFKEEGSPFSENFDAFPDSQQP